MNSLAAKIKKPYLVIQIIAALAIFVGGIIAVVNAFNIYSKAQEGLILRNLIEMAKSALSYTNGFTLLRVGAIVSFCIAIAMKLIARKSNSTPPITVNGFGISIVCFFLSLLILPYSSLGNLAQHTYEAISYDNENWLNTLKSEVPFVAFYVIATMFLAVVLIIIAIINLTKKESSYSLEKQ